MARWFTRAIQPPDDIVPNPNPPGSVPPATVGPPSAVPGDPSGVTIAGADGDWQPPRIVPMPWSGWPSDWLPPAWGGGGGANLAAMSDTAWMCIDLNASLLSTMPPYLVGAAPSLNSDWLNNPDPDVYQSWEEFAKQLFWDYQLGEAFVWTTARYATGWPARFRVIPPWMVSIEIQGGQRYYEIGGVDVSADMLHVRYTSTVGYAHGQGPLEAGWSRVIAANLLRQYSTGLAQAGGIPSSVLQHPEELTAEQAAQLQQQWVQARLSQIGEPAVLSGGVTWQATQINPKDMALIELQQFNESRIAVLCGVPPFIVGLPSGGDPMTYKNVLSIFDFHWRASLRPKAQSVMSALSGFLLPRGSQVELNRDAYVEPDPYARAQTYQILNAIVDPVTGQQALTVAEIRQAERLSNSSPSDDLAGGVLR